MDLHDRLDELAKSFFNAWSVWRKSQGWSLGPDRSEAKMSPYLVHSFEALDAEGQAWFRQHVALVLHVIDEADPGVLKRNEKATKKLFQGWKLLTAGENDAAEVKIRTALKLLKGLPVKAKVKPEG